MLHGMERNKGQDEMQPHQQRVVDEKAELDEKLTKLRAFMPDDESNKIFMGLPQDEKVRLIRQEAVMSEYSEILGERIAAF